MKKMLYGILVISLIMMVASCVTVPKTGFDKEKMNVVNMLGYSEDTLSIEFAKEIWNDQVSVISLIEKGDYQLAYNTESKNSFEVYVDPMGKGIDFSTELATLVSCVGYLRENEGSETLISDTKDYAKNIYDLIITNVQEGNNVTFENEETFKDYLENLSIEKVGNIYYIR